MVRLMSPENGSQTVAIAVVGVAVYADGIILLRAIRKDVIAFLRGLLLGLSAQRIDR